MRMFEEEEPSWYDTAQVCLNGHLINNCAKSQPISNKKHCPTCGAATITDCPTCSAPIKGYHHIPGVVYVGSSEPDKYCDNCGASYPWTEARVKAAQDLASELDNLSAEEKANLQKSLPDIVRDSPQTSVAATRFKKLAAKAGTKSAELIWDLVKDLASETAKKIILGK
jgi:hypothetical protein